MIHPLYQATGVSHFEAADGKDYVYLFGGRVQGRQQGSQMNTWPVLVLCSRHSWSTTIIWKHQTSLQPNVVDLLSHLLYTSRSNNHRGELWQILWSSIWNYQDGNSSTICPFQCMEPFRMWRYRLTHQVIEELWLHIFDIRNLSTNPWTYTEHEMQLCITCKVGPGKARQNS